MRAPASAPTDDIVSLRDLLDFISHVAHCYPDITNGFPQDLIALLSRQHDVLEPMLREKIVTSLVLLRKKGLLDSASYVSLFSPRILYVTRICTHTIVQIDQRPFPNPFINPEQVSPYASLPENSLRFAHLQCKNDQPQGQSCSSNHTFQPRRV